MMTTLAGVVFGISGLAAGERTLPPDPMAGHWRVTPGVVDPNVSHPASYASHATLAMHRPVPARPADENCRHPCAIMFRGAPVPATSQRPAPTPLILEAFVSTRLDAIDR